MKDVIIIGMGISGITAALYLKRANLNVLLLEEKMPGGLLNEISEVENYPGFTSISGFDLANNLFKQIKSNEVPYAFAQFINLEKTENSYRVITNKGAYETKKVILAMGRVPKNIGLKDEEKYLGKGISTCASCDGPLYRDKNVVVVGSGSSAMQEALYLASIVKKVYIVIRKDKFSGEFNVNKILNKENIVVIYKDKVVDLIFQDEKMQGVLLESGKKLEVSCLFKYVGFIPNTKMLKPNFAYLLDEDGYVKNAQNDGIYACGDIVKDNVKQLTTAAASGVQVALDIIKRGVNG